MSHFCLKWFPVSTSANLSFCPPFLHPQRTWNFPCTLWRFVGHWHSTSHALSPSESQHDCSSVCIHTRGLPVSPQTISKWIMALIRLAYDLAKVPLPTSVKAHSTRTVATSTAFLRGVDLDDICWAATWSALSTFADHYCMDVRARKDASFGQAVLQSVLL